MFATLAGSNDLAARTDTIDRYIINGQTVTRFDGSQLVSKTIVNYDISYKTTPDAVIKEHNITTRKAYQITDVMNTPAENLPEGTSVKSTTFEAGSGVTSTTVKSNGLKNMVELEGAFPAGEKPILIIDGEVSKASLDDIDPDKIKSLTVLRGKAATQIWGDQGKNGVIEITTKK